MHSHTLSYRDKDDLIRQLDALLTKLMASPVLTKYNTVRGRYPHLKPTAFTMRLKRFEKRGGHIPQRRGSAGRKIVALFVTPALDAHLRK